MKAKKQEESTQDGGSMYADYVTATGGSVYADNTGTTTFWRGSGKAITEFNYTELSIANLMPLPATVYDVKGNVIDQSKTQVFIRIAPWIGESGDVATYFDDLEVEYKSKGGNQVFYTADIQQSTSYYSFGSPMPGKGINGDYRYGYQGSEKDDEVSGGGNSYTTEFRMLETRLGRWWAPDPAFRPWESSYTSMSNDPINLNDIYGLSPSDKDDPDGDGNVTVNGNKYGLKDHEDVDNYFDLTAEDFIDYYNKKYPQDIKNDATQTANDGGGFFDWLGGVLEKMDQAATGSSEFHPYGNSKQEFVAVVFTTEGATNSSDPSTQKAADDAKVIYSDGDAFGDFLSILGKMKDGGYQPGKVANKKPVQRHNYDASKKFYKGKFLGKNLKNRLDFENAVIDKYNQSLGISLSENQLKNINKVFGDNFKPKVRPATAEEVKQDVQYTADQQHDNLSLKEAAFKEFGVKAVKKVLYEDGSEGLWVIRTNGDQTLEMLTNQKEIDALSPYAE